MNEFDWCEQKGRELFETVLKAAKISNYEFSNDKHSIWDAKYSTDSVENIVEIKVRKQDYTAYPDWILELKKYKALKALATEQQKNTTKKVSAYYVNFFNDGYFCIWAINNVDETTVQSKSCKATTAANKGYISKEILPLKVNDSILFGQIKDNKVITHTI